MATLISPAACAGRAAPSRHKPGGQPSGVPVRTFDRQFCLALLLTIMVLVPRSLLVARAHSESCDDDYHLTRGLAFWTRTLGRGRLGTQRSAARRGSDRSPDAGVEPRLRTGRRRRPSLRSARTGRVDRAAGRARQRRTGNPALRTRLPLVPECLRSDRPGWRLRSCSSTRRSPRWCPSRRQTSWDSKESCSAASSPGATSSDRRPRVRCLRGGDRAGPDAQAHGHRRRRSSWPWPPCTGSGHPGAAWGGPTGERHWPGASAMGRARTGGAGDDLHPDAVRLHAPISAVNSLHAEPEAEHAHGPAPFLARGINISWRHSRYRTGWVGASRHPPRSRQTPRIGSSGRRSAGPPPAAHPYRLSSRGR